MPPLPRFLAPWPSWMTPTRTAIAAVAAVTAAGAPVVVSAIPELRQIIRPGFVAPTTVAIVCSALAAIVASRTVTRRNTLAARTACLVGASIAGMLAIVASYIAVLLVGGSSRIAYGEEMTVLLSMSFVGGAPLGCLFGIVFAPVLVAATRARLGPTHDGVDRVMVPFGGAWMIAGAAGVLIAGRIPLPSVAVAIVGAAIATTCAARIVGRAWFVNQARTGAFPGWSVEPLSDAEEEDALVPFVQTEPAPLGVLVAAGTSAPYRGTRGATRYALALLSTQPSERPILGLASWLLDEIGAACLSVPAACAGIGMVGLAIGMLALMLGAAR